MAKLKIRKLLRDQNTLVKRLDELTALLAYVVHRCGGEMVFTPDDIMQVPDGVFSINSEDGSLVLKIKYNEASEVSQEDENTEQEPEA